MTRHVWSRNGVRVTDTITLLSVYTQEVEHLRAAATNGATDEQKHALVGRVFIMRLELKRRKVIPDYPYPSVTRYAPPHVCPDCGAHCTCDEGQDACDHYCDT